MPGDAQQGASAIGRSARRTSRPASAMRESPHATWSSIASLPKPDGFFDPKAPAGFPSPPEQTREEEEEVRRIEREHERAGTPAPPRPGADNLNLGNSDLAFRQNQVFIGNFHGFNVYDIENAWEATAARVGRVPRRSGRRVGSRQPPVHVGRTVAWPARLRHGGVQAPGQRRAFSRHPHLRHQRYPKAETDSRCADVPRIAYAHAARRS